MKTWQVDFLDFASSFHRFTDLGRKFAPNRSCKIEVLKVLVHGRIILASNQLISLHMLTLHVPKAHETEVHPSRSKSAQSFQKILTKRLQFALFKSHFLSFRMKGTDPEWGANNG